MSGAASRTECAWGGWHDPSSQASSQLEPSILALFLLLTVPVFFTVIAVTYLSNGDIAHGDAAELQKGFRIDAPANIEEEFNPLKSLVRSRAGWIAAPP